jgi:hypothetical protein
VHEQGELFLAYINTSSRFVLLFFGHFQKGTHTKHGWSSHYTFHRFVQRKPSNLTKLIADKEAYTH